MTSNQPEPDFLDEDNVIGNQKFFVLSYMLPANPEDQPTLKVRGSFSTVEECEKRIKRLQSEDKYFNMYIAEVGKWGVLMTDEQIKKQDIENVYADGKLNELIKGYKENKDKLDLANAERTESMKQKARQEGSKEGQLELANAPENPKTVKIRLEGYDEQILKLNQELEEVHKNHEKSLKVWKAFDEQAIKDSEKEYDDYINKLKIE
jgi:hypothetical protein